MSNAQEIPSPCTKRTRNRKSKKNRLTWMSNITDQGALQQLIFQKECTEGNADMIGGETLRSSVIPIIPTVQQDPDNAVQDSTLMNQLLATQGEQPAFVHAPLQEYVNVEDDGHIPEQIPDNIPNTDEADGYHEIDEVVEEGSFIDLVDDMSLAPEEEHAESLVDDAVEVEVLARNDLRKLLRRRLKIKMTMQTFLGAVTVYGKARFSLRQYEHLCFILKGLTGSSHLPSVNSVRQTIWPYFARTLFVPSRIRQLPVNERFALSRQGCSRDSDGVWRRSTLVVLPSEWAKIDVATLFIYEELFRSHGTKSVRELRIEDCAIIQQREVLSNRSRRLWVRKRRLQVPACEGDAISLQCVEKPLIRSNSPTFYGWVELDDDTGNPDVGRNHGFIGEVRVTFSVGAAGGEQSNELFDWERSIMEQLLTKSNEASHDGVKQNRSANRPRSRRRRLWETSNSSEFAHQPQDFSILPGDVCTILRPTQTSNGESSICVFVNRFWRSATRDSGDFILWFVQSSTTPTNVYLVDGVPLLVETDNTMKSDPFTAVHDRDVRSGILQSGEPYVVYRMLLYCDDFNPRSLLFPRGSVGGCYMIPIGLSLQRRRGLTSIRPIALTPPGVSTNYVLDDIIEDIVEGTVSGFDGEDASGRKVKIFLDVVGFVADYPASSNVLDVMSHAAKAPCTHCTFRHRSAPGDTDYAYSTNIDSSHSSFVRGMHRTVSVRQSTLSDDDAKWLGMRKGGISVIDEPGQWPLLKLTKTLQSRQSEIPFNMEGERVVSGFFDAYLSNAVAPDHLLTGLGSHLLDVMFKQLEDTAMKRRVDIVICSTLKQIGCHSQTTICNVKMDCAHSMSMSAMYGVLLIMPYVLKSLSLEKKTPTYALFTTLHKIVGLTFWWPAIGTDGEKAVDYVHGSKRDEYYSDLQRLAVQYLTEVSLFCKAYPSAKSKVDRPNVHRLLELFSHTIPIFGHGLFVAELVFESAHQPLKAALSRNTSCNAHIPALEQLLGRDWFTRIAELWDCFERGDATQRAMAMKGLRLLMVGSESANLRPLDDPDDDRLESECDAHIFNILDSVAGKRLTSWYGSRPGRWDTEGQWRGSGVVKVGEQSQSDNIDRKKQFREMALRMVEQCCAREPTGSLSPSPFEKALLKKRGAAGKSYPQHVVRIGDVVEAFLKDADVQSVIEEPNEEGIGSIALFLVRAIVGWESSDPWALVTRMKKGGQENLYVPLSNHLRATQLLLISPSVRKVCAVHACDVADTCSVDFTSKTISHTISMSQGESFYLLRRQDGYPCRNA